MKKREFTKEEKRFIVEHRETMTITEISIALNISRSTVGNYMRANELTASKELKSKRLSEKNTIVNDNFISFVRSNYPAMSAEQIGKETGFSCTTVWRYIKKIGLPTASRGKGERRHLLVRYPEIDDFIRANYPKMGMKKIANKLHTTDEVIRRRLLYIGMKIGDKHRRKWNFTEEQNNFIRNNRNLGYRKIAKILGIEENAVFRHIKRNNF